MPTQVRIGWRSGSSSQTAASIVTSGLVLNLDAGNVSSYSGTGTTWTDLSGNNLNATLVNGTTYRTSYGGYFQFDGINDAAVLAYNDKINTSSFYTDLPFSFNGWVNFNPSINGENKGTFLHKGDNGDGYSITYYVNITSTGLYIVLYGNNGNVKISTTGLTLSPNTWYNFGITYTGGYRTTDPVFQTEHNGIMKLYINGAEISTSITYTGTYIRMVNNNTSTFIGSFGQVGSPGSYWATSFNGSVAQTLMYSRQLTSTEVLQNFNATKARFTLDTDAQAFITAASITDATQVSAVNTLVTSLKSAGIWTKLKAVYPFVGGTATSHKFNLKDPRDLDAAYRLVFNGGWVHSSTGAKPNGTTAYANTYLNPHVTFGNAQSHLPANSTHALVHISKYSRTNSTITDNFDGVYTGAYPQSCWLGMGWNSGWAPNGAGFINTRSTNPSSVSLGNRTDGFFVVNRDGYTSLKSFRNSTIVSTDTTDSRAYNEVGLQLNLNPQNVFLIGALNNAYNFTFIPLLYNNFETSFQSIGWSLTDAEALAFYNAVQAFQTTLGRQV